MQGTLLLKQAVHRNAQGIATVCGTRKRRWHEVGDRVPRMAAALHRLGVEDGGFVAVLAMNSDRYLELFYAVPWAGGCFAPMNVRWSAHENLYALQDCNAVILCVDDAFAEQGRQLREAFPGLRAVIHIGDAPTPEGMLSYEELIASHDGMEDADRKGEDLYAVFYTGGTTGQPKGVALSHAALGHAATAWLAMIPDVEDLSFAYVGGFFHFSGASPVHYITMAGGTHVVLPKFEPLAMMQAIHDHKVSNAVMVPTIVNMLISHPDFDKYDLSNLRTCVYGGSPMPEALMAAAAAKLPHLRFYQIYGMTETGGFATMLRWRDHVFSGPKAERIRSCGQPGPGVEVRIVSPDGKTLPPRQLGEIAMRSDYLMMGYLGKPDQTAEVLRDGWMHSGDAGYLDEDGYLYVADRVKDMIVTGGENVYSIEVERALFQHSAVHEAAVIGIPSQEWGEQVHAIVVLKPGATATEEELIAHCRTLIGGYKCPKSVEFRSEPLPLAPKNTVMKNVLRDSYWMGHERKI